MISLKVRQVGNSLGVVLPKEVLSRLKVNKGDILYLTDSPDGSMRVTPFEPEFERQMEIAQKYMRKYRNALRELAK